jgi:salicylate hydroxylase
MAYTTLHVLIIGGGLGGLCLAQGLRQAGISVAVYERDRSPTDREQGYRIHLDPVGSRGLHACLPPELYEFFLKTSGRAGEGFVFLDEQLEELLFIGGDDSSDPDPIDSHKSVSRITLRQILLMGLEKVIHFGKTFSHYAVGDDGRVTAFFEDGSAATGDLLVGADGGNSRVRQQFLPHAQRVETGVLGIMGKLPLNPETRALLPPGRFDIAGIVLGPRGHNMFVARHEFDESLALPATASPRAAVSEVARPAVATVDTEPLDTDPVFENTRSYIMWGLLDHRERMAWPGDPFALSGHALQEVAAQAISGWHPRLQMLVRQADPATVLCTSIRTSEPVAPWQTGPVTLVGDAIHSMTPLRGMGGNTALRDAALLCEKLQAVQRDELSLVDAVHQYEQKMRDYGFAAVRQSKQTLDLVAAANPMKRALLKIALRGVNTVMKWRKG